MKGAPDVLLVLGPRWAAGLLASGMLPADTPPALPRAEPPAGSRSRLLLLPGTDQGPAAGVGREWGPGVFSVRSWTGKGESGGGLEGSSFSAR